MRSDDMTMRVLGAVTRAGGCVIGCVATGALVGASLVVAGVYAASAVLAVLVVIVGVAAWALLSV